MTALEEKGGSDGNSSVAELEVRVETLEGIVTEHETRIFAVEAELNGRNYNTPKQFLLFQTKVSTCKLSEATKPAKRAL